MVTPDLREFTKENDQRVYDFCAYLLVEDSSVEDLVLSIFRAFGDYFRRLRVMTADNAPSEEMRLRLFQIAWRQIQSALHHSYLPILGGRDTRLLKGIDDDLLPSRTESKDRSAQKEPRVRDRLARVDAELRAPVVLRDILKFTDEEAAKILGLRWGVYRHRLHRGRLDFKDALKGQPFALSGKGASANA